MIRPIQSSVDQNPVESTYRGTRELAIFTLDYYSHSGLAYAASRDVHVTSSPHLTTCGWIKSQACSRTAGNHKKSRKSRLVRIKHYPYSVKNDFLGILQFALPLILSFLGIRYGKPNFPRSQCEYGDRH
jgi:hypothetical protein